MNEVKTKSTPAHWLLWTYFGHTLDYRWSAFGMLLNAFGCSLMRADERRCALMTSGDSGVSPNNRYVRFLCYAVIFRAGSRDISALDCRILCRVLQTAHGIR